MLLRTYSTLGPVGFLPAGGTWASCITLLIAYIIGFFDLSFFHQIIAVISIFTTALYAIHTTRWQFGYRTDPAEIVIDESVGILLAFIGLPITSISIIAGFVLFRALDIYKPWPISRMEKLPYAWGILLDDCVAGLCSWAILQLIHCYC
jgi:phosphatidylglycerophosphatase A